MDGGGEREGVGGQRKRGLSLLSLSVFVHLERGCFVTRAMVESGRCII